jgi:hypothetical protein
MKLIILFLIFKHLTLLLGQQCTALQYQRCLCVSVTPYCPCAALTTTNALNFASTYRSHLVAVTNYGCRPCPVDCLRCTSVSVCVECRAYYELVAGVCVGCPINCQQCANGVCSLCGEGYYLDYQTNCQSCPITGTKVCTISSLISCLSNYWLDNNAANCLPCDPNCQQCSSTTRCSLCLTGYYLTSNFTCGKCMAQCGSCSGNTTCSSCLTEGTVYSASSGGCIGGSVSGCKYYDSAGICITCNSSTYLSGNSCLGVPPASLINQCLVHHLTSNNS